MGLVSPPGLPCFFLPQAWHPAFSSLLSQPFPRQILIHSLLSPPQTLPAPMPGPPQGVPSTANRHNLELGRSSRATSTVTRAAVLPQRL